MPVLPTYQAPVGTGQEASRYISGLDAGQSLMERADANRRANSAEQRQQEIYDVTAPLRQVTQDANIAKAKSQIAGYGILQEATIGVQDMLPRAIKDFSFMPQIEDSQARADYALEALSRYSQLSLIPELKPMMDQFTHAAGYAINENLKIKTARQLNGNASFTPVNLPNPDGSVTPMSYNRRTGTYEAPNVQPSAAPAQSAVTADGSPSQAQPTPQIFRSQTPGEKKAQVVEAEHVAKVKAEKPKRDFGIQKAELSTQRFEEDLDALISKATARSTGAGGAILGKFDGSAAADLQENIQAIESGIMLQAMQDMRAASPTGSTGLGQMAVSEGDKLAKQYGSLSVRQSPAQFIENVKKVKKRLQENAALVRAAYRADYGDAEPGPAPSAQTPAAAASGEQRAQSILDKYGIK